MWAVRRSDSWAVADTLACEDPYALAVVLAATVPVPVDVSARLAWTGAPLLRGEEPHLRHAVELAGAVRGWDYSRLRELLSRPLAGACVFLAALAEPSRTDAALLGWVSSSYGHHFGQPRRPVDYRAGPGGERLSPTLSVATISKTGTATRE